MKTLGVWLCLSTAFCVVWWMLGCKAYETKTQTRKEIIGYYPSWKLERPGTHLAPENIHYSELTVINYAFFYPLKDGTLVGRDAVGDKRILKGEADGHGGYKPGTGLVELSHKHGVKVLLSLGGWEDSNNFPQVAAHESTRWNFAHSCVDQLQKFGFDGIDIDWEFPCMAEHQGTPDDKLNYVQLLKTTRDSLDAYGTQTGKRYMLTAALPATAAGVERSFLMEKIVPLLDLLNIMTYDLNGPWDSLSGHNAPLFAPRADDTLRNLDASFRVFTETYDVPPSKVNLGVPFYAHTYRECTALYSPHKGSDTEHFSHEGCFYYDIVQSQKQFTRMWDDHAKVPYLVSPEWNVLVSYDDEESVGYKAQYVVDKNARGLIIWEITGDYLPDGRTPLLDVIHKKFTGSTSR